MRVCLCCSLGKVLPVTAYDKDGVRLLLHFASECPAGRTDVLVVVLSWLNTAPLPVRNVSLQAAVPKVGDYLCLCVQVCVSLPHTHTHTLSHTQTHIHVHTTEYTHSRLTEVSLIVVVLSIPVSLSSP